MVSVLFFARYREVLATEQLQLDWQDDWQTLADVRNFLLQRGGPWTVLNDKTLMCALNDAMCSLDSRISKGDRIMFFPLVTGG